MEKGITSMGKVKVLYIHHSESQSGAARSLSFLIDRLDKEKYEPYVLCMFDEEGNRELFESVGAKLLYKKISPWHGSTVSGMSFIIFLHNVKYLLPTLFGMKEILEKVQPDIVHLNSTCLCFAAAAIKRWKKDLSIVCHVREPLLDGFWGDILRKVNEPNVDYYVAIEKYDADSLHTALPVEVVPNFVDFSVYNERVESKCLFDELEIPYDHKILLYLARISPQNGALECVNALKDYLTNNQEVHFCVVGADFDNRSNYLDEIIAVSKILPNNLHILPFRTDVPNVIASSDVMLVPFQTPHFARSVIEAAAMGVPSIGTCVGGLEELIVHGKTGFLVDPKSFEGLAEYCDELLDQGKRASFVKNAIEYAHENFDAEKNSNRTFEIYEKLLGNKG